MSYQENSGSVVQVCRFFQLNRFCKFSRSCRYSHDIASTHAPDNLSKDRPQPQSQTKRTFSKQNDHVQKKTEMKSCRDFKSSGGCSYGDKCRFSHVVDGCTTEKVMSSEKNIQPPKVTPNSSFVYNLTSLNETELVKLRTSEIAALKKRYPQAKQTGSTFNVIFKPTDPDWPYDIKELPLDITFPPDYPKDMANITVSENVSENVPDTVRQYVYASIRDWISSRYNEMLLQNKTELVLRSFNRWLDRSLEDIFTKALTRYKHQLLAQAAGIEILPGTNLQEQYKNMATESKDDTVTVESEHDEEDDDDEEEEFSLHEDVADLSIRPDEQVKADTSPVVSGVEIRGITLVMSESVGVLSITNAHIIITCSRCRNPRDVTIDAGKLTQIECTTCHVKSRFYYKSEFVHSSSSVFGHIELDECEVKDLVLSRSHFVVQCLECNCDNLKDGLWPGRPNDIWCQHCHKKLQVSIESIRFIRLHGVSQNLQSACKPENTIKAPARRKQTVVEGGKPLPDNGTCKHYKKSFRWLRFPCCGMVYPCDVCHDENEDGHEMKLATRMLCGHCAREQPYSPSKPCINCHVDMTAGRTQHWEGGKGCRDKIKMSRNDDKKYANMNKTISRKQHELSTKKPKKKSFADIEKLRRT